MPKKVLYNQKELLDMIFALQTFDIHLAAAGCSITVFTHHNLMQLLQKLRVRTINSYSGASIYSTTA